MRRISLALLHHPVLDRKGDVVSSAITNLDLHDIARSACCYGLERYYVVHPIAAQRLLVEQVVDHWLTGSGGRRIPDRVIPMQLISVVTDLDQALADFGRGDRVEVWTTSAGEAAHPLEHGPARKRVSEGTSPLMLLFGTGWGLAPVVHERADLCLAPIRSLRADGHNHLSVRAAVAILLDRLFGGRGEDG